MWSTEGSRVLSRQNNVFRTETVIVQKGNTRQSTVYQGNFGMLLVSLVMYYTVHIINFQQHKGS